MTVEKLIEELSKYPKDTIVKIYQKQSGCKDRYWDELYDVYYDSVYDVIKLGDN